MKIIKNYVAAFLVLSFVLTGCDNNTDTVMNPRDAAIQKAEAWENKRYEDILAQEDIPVYRYKILNEFDHNESSFTEGLTFDDGLLYESAGLWDQSRLVTVDIRTGGIEKRHDLAPSYFAEGITVLGDEVFQLTYQSDIGFVYQKDDLRLKRSFNFPSQGWGLTDDESQLIMSNGSSVLLFIDPKTMKTERYVIVADQVGPVSNLNELEYINGEIYANIYKSTLIARISPEFGTVTGWIDMSGINPDPTVLKDLFVLNGIAYDKQTDNIFVTGKCWPKVYEIELVAPD
ncbi:MAG: glutaminyl-peptide cyclotransferase [Campylobacterota bacterium]|nr:glutaminyl-peptide cyclotransferase [Campylobacterota bacterium]